jgi:peptide/nickel transport system substrate-binding protein
MLSEYVHNDHVTLVRNPDYAWGPPIFKHTGPSVLESLVYRLLPEDATRVAALKSGEIDLIDRVAPRDLADFQSNDDYKTLIGETGGMPWFMPLNTQKAPTDDPAVRQAMMMTFDQAAVVDLLFKGTLEPAYSLLEPTVIGFSEDHKALITHDPEGAKALLEEAGWTEGSDGIREKDGQPLKVVNLIVANFGMDEMSVAIQSQLREVGIDMEIRSAEAAATFAALDAGEHNCTWAFYWWADPSGGLELFFRSDRIGSGNASFLASPELDKLLADGRATGDDAQRASLYSQAVSLILQEYAALPAFSKRLVLASKASVDMESVQTNVEGYPNFYDVGFVE